MTNNGSITFLGLRNITYNVYIHQVNDGVKRCHERSIIKKRRVFMLMPE